MRERIIMPSLKLEQPFDYETLTSGPDPEEDDFRTDPERGGVELFEPTD